MKKIEFMNNCKLLVLSSCLSICYWMICNNELTYLSLSYELYRQVNGSLYGYSSLQSYSLIYILFFIIILYIHNTKEQEFYIVRLSSRQKILENRLIDLIKSVGIVFIPHFMVNVIGITIYFKVNFLCEMNYYFYELLQFVVVSLCFCSIGLIYMYLSDFLKKEILNFIVPLSFMIFYFFNRIFIDYMLMRDLCVKDLLIANSISYIEIVFGILKYLIVIVVLIQLMKLKIKEKDIYEK